MKFSLLRITPLAVAAIFTASNASIAQTTTATTTPVGFITLDVAGAGAASSQLSFKGLGLTRSIEYQGNAETIGGSSVTDDQATWVDDQFNGTSAYYLEIISGPRAGVILDIEDTFDGTNTITTSQPLPSGIAAGTSFVVRKHWTIASVFGAANEGGLGAGNSGNADQILIYTTATQSYSTFYYKSGGIGGTGWRNLETGADAAGQVIYPDDGLLINRKQAGAVNVVLMGAVKTGQTSIPVSDGLNILANVYASSMTLGTSGLYTGDASTGVAFGNSSSADQVLIYDPVTSAYKTYYYKFGGIGGNGWRNVETGEEAAGTVVPVGSSVIVQRKTGTGFDWIAPQHPATL